MNANNIDDYLVIGEIVKPQGVRGEMKLRPITCDVARFDGLDYAFVKRDNAFSRIAIQVGRIEPDAVYLSIEGVADRTQAEGLRGTLLYIDRAHAVPLDPDSNFLCDLIGCHVADDEGNDLGSLTDVLQPGGGDVYVLRGARGEILVPALKSVVLSVDIARKEMLLCAKRLREVAVFEE